MHSDQARGSIVFGNITGNSRSNFSLMNSWIRYCRATAVTLEIPRLLSSSHSGNL